MALIVKLYALTSAPTWNLAMSPFLLRIGITYPLPIIAKDNAPPDTSLSL